MDALLQLTWWEVSLSAIGSLAIIGVLISIFVTHETFAYEFKAKGKLPSPREDLIPLSRLLNAPITEGGEIQILNNGSSFLESLIEDIKKANSSINLTNFIFRKGEMSSNILNALIEKAEQGVEIRILLDTVGSKFAPFNKLDELRDVGGLVKYFRTPRIGKLTRFHKRNHRRAIVIDNSVGYVGGLAIDDKWLGNADLPTRWRDTMFRLCGPMANHAQSAFAEIWTGTTGEILGEEFYCPPKGQGDIRSLNILSSPADDVQPLLPFFWYSINSAREKCYISSPYFLPPQSITSEIIKAAQRGVDVRIILPSYLTDAKLVRLASRTNYEDLLKAGVKIYEFQGSRFHSKHMIIDTEWSIVGSANMDHRSFLLNQENIVGISSKDFGRSMEDLFLSDLERCLEINLEDWRKRNLLTRPLEQAARLLKKQF